ncbi:hypothetical protein MSAN_00280300 [Mycena sanguinolenta]|uniref:Uncharacterized protein n=1 Tax=Mycena sanguinolenta TaxID=230812 RepID=A0A8H6ZE73_9AGAR|nr:hypothetical protein MSAN_00280300 [Mycena sanguinolenta]
MTWHGVDAEKSVGQNGEMVAQKPEIPRYRCARDRKHAHTLNTDPDPILPLHRVRSEASASSSSRSAGGSRSAGPSASCAPVAGPSGESRGSLGTPALLRGSSSNGPSRARVVDRTDVPLGPVEGDADMDAPEHAGPSEEEPKEKTPPFLPGTASPVGAPPSPPAAPIEEDTAPQAANNNAGVASEQLVERPVTPSGVEDEMVGESG